jgi:hypothetical protein
MVAGCANKRIHPLAAAETALLGSSVENQYKKQEDDCNFFENYSEIHGSVE